MDIYFKNTSNKLMLLLNKPQSLSNTHFSLTTLNLRHISEFLGDSYIFSNKIYLLEEDSEIPDNCNIMEVKGKFSLVGDEGRYLLDALSIFWKGMPGGLMNVNYNPFLNFDLAASKEIVFYGGSFNPWHDGHTECLKRCSSKDIVIVPDFNPWKESPANPVCRYSSFIEIYDNVKKLGYSLYPGFWAMNKSNPTINWIDKVEAQGKSLLIGDDNFIQIFKWTDSQKLLNILDKIYVVKRNFERSDFLRVEKEIIDKGISLDIIYIEENSFKDTSSTKIRKKKGL